MISHVIISTGGMFWIKNSIPYTVRTSRQRSCNQRVYENHALHRKIESEITKNNTYWFINYDYDLNGYNQRQLN